MYPLTFRIALMLFCAAFELSALVVQKLADLNTMAQKCDAILHGYVGEQEVKLDEYGRPVTLTKVEVIDGLYGVKTGQVVTLYQVGGTLNGITLPIVGGQNYQVGQEVIFFGLKAGDSLVNFGAGQGKLDVSTSTHLDQVTEDLGTISALPSAGKTGESVRPLALSFPDVELLKNEIRLMVQERVKQVQP